MMDGMQEQIPYTIEEFAGGITDYYVDGPQNGAQYMENLLLTPSRKLTTRDGTNYWVDAQIGALATRGAIVNHFEEPLFLQARKAFYKSAPNAYAQIFGPNNGGATDPALSDSAVTTSSILSAASWKGHTFAVTDDMTQPEKFFKDSVGTWRVRTAGLPKPPSLSAVAGTSGTTYSYLYAVVYSYQYSVGNQVFEDRSSPYLITAQAGAAVAGGAAITLTLPQFTGYGKNWDQVSINQEIYRTINNGRDLYLVTSQAYNVTTYSDVMPDATLLNQAPCYINGGVLDNDLPPQCKYLHIMGDVGYYAYCKDSTGTYPYQIRQSVPGDIDSVPGSNNLEVVEPVTGITSHNSKPIVMCTNKVFRVEGGFDQFGQGSMTAIEISPNAGCVSHQSIVQTPLGIFWFGTDGIYHSEGYVVHKITTHLPLTYKLLTANSTKQKRVQGTYHADLECVVWACSRTDSNNENDSLLVLDLRWGLRIGALDVKQTPATFYFWSSTNFSSVRWVNRQLLLNTDKGYALYLDSTRNFDVKAQSSGSPSTWNETTLLYNWVSTASDLGTKQYRKWVPRFVVDFTSSSSLSMAITSISDGGRLTAVLKPIRYRGNVIWGIGDVFWGSGGYTWEKAGTLDYKRRMPAGALRSMHRQVGLSNAKEVILSSSTLGSVTVNKGSLTVVLHGTLVWPSQFTDYVIAFANDGYVREFTIATVSTNTVVVTDPTGNFPASGTYNFVVRGYPKGESLNLNSVQIWFQPVSKTQTGYVASDSGEPST